MNTKSKSAIKVIAYAIENDTQNLKQLLQRNGIMIDDSLSNDELQLVVTGALAKSETFRNEFKNWVLSRSNFSDYANSSGFTPDPSISSGIGFQPGSSGAYQTTNSNTQQTFGGLNFGLPATSGSSNSVSSTTATALTANGPWHLDLNTILDFAKEGLNTYSLALQTKNESTISNNALAMEREKINNSNVTKSSNNTTMIVVASIVALVAIGGTVFYLKGKK